MGLFSAIKSGLQKTREALLGELKGIVGVGKITDETLEDLEEQRKKQLEKEYREKISKERGLLENKIKKIF